MGPAEASVDGVCESAGEARANLEDEPPPLVVPTLPPPPLEAVGKPAAEDDCEFA